jgi:catechol 2,3-dioxygenase-like lactoylglutathione lyase family enzyme
MQLVKLAHYAVRATDLEASRWFYTEVLGLRVGYRPPFEFAGMWLYLGGDETEFGVVHLIGSDEGADLSRYLGERPGDNAGGTGSLDHIAFMARDWPAIRARCLAHGIDHTERVVPALGLLQVFLVDPAGVTVELNFPADEAEQLA